MTSLEQELQTAQSLVNDGDFVAGGVSVGYDYTNGNWDISPQLSLAYRDVSLDGYVESDSLGGGLSLAYDKQERFQSARAFRASPPPAS